MLQQIFFPTLVDCSNPSLTPLRSLHSSNNMTAVRSQRIHRHDEYYIHGGDVVFCVRMSIIGYHVRC